MGRESYTIINMFLPIIAGQIARTVAGRTLARVGAQAATKKVGEKVAQKGAEVVTRQIVKRKLRPGDEAVFMPGKEREKILGLKNATDEDNARRIGADTSSPTQPQIISDEAQYGMSREMREKINNPLGRKKTKEDGTTTDEQTEKNIAEAETEEKRIEVENIQEELRQRAMALDDLESLAQEQEAKYEEVIKRLDASGIKMKRNEVDEILNAGFKVKFPIALIIIFVIQIFAGISFPLISGVFTIIGLAGSWVPIVGQIVGGSLAAIGLTFTILTFIFEGIVSMISAALRLYYVRTASAILKKVNFVKRYALKYTFTTAIIIFFGSIPFISIIVSFLVMISVYIMAKRETKKVQKIFESVFG